MAGELRVKIYQRDDLDKHLSKREGETKLGQAIRLLESSDVEIIPATLSKAFKSGARYAIVMIPEDIGPRANCGRGGAQKASQSFLSYFLNMQANRFFDYSQVVMIGEVDVDDLMANSQAQPVESLRELCARLDERVAPLIRRIVLSGLEPIVIGGGNNNSLPVIQGVVEALRTFDSSCGLAVVNCDPHADFRRLEGRHSGNPFSYAHDRGYLKRYCIFGLHENYNNEDMLERLAKYGYPTFSYEDFAIRHQLSFEDALVKVCDYLSRGGHPVGCELDVDGVRNMPASARTPFGLSQEQAAQFIHTIASRLDSLYLHLSEAAPEWSVDEGDKQAGKGLALMVVTYLKARDQFRKGRGDLVGIPRFLQTQVATRAYGELQCQTQQSSG